MASTSGQDFAAQPASRRPGAGPRGRRIALIALCVVGGVVSAVLAARIPLLAVPSFLLLVLAAALLGLTWRAVFGVGVALLGAATVAFVASRPASRFLATLAYAFMAGGSVLGLFERPLSRLVGRVGSRAETDAADGSAPASEPEPPKESERS